MGMMRRVPWWTKLGAKLVLARLPLAYSFWQRVGLFRHGETNHPARAIDTFCTYFERARGYMPLEPGFTSLELGPGDSVLTGLTAKAMGASKAWLVDAGSFATTDIAACMRTAQLLRERGANPADITGAKNLQEVLQRSDVHYLTGGTASLAQIPDASVDFFWSQVVLEHVPKAEFLTMMRELRRIMKPGSIGVHSIDFRDHLGGGLNNLRFSEALWESRFFSRSGFYTNRLRPREMLALMQQAGFAVEVLKQARWPELPLPRSNMAREFQHFSDEDFMVCEIEIIARPGGL